MKSEQPSTIIMIPDSITLSYSVANHDELPPIGYGTTFTIHGLECKVISVQCLNRHTDGGVNPHSHQLTARVYYTSVDVVYE